MTISRNAAGKYVATGVDRDGTMELEAEYITFTAAAAERLAGLFRDPNRRQPKEPEKEIAGTPPKLGMTDEDFGEPSAGLRSHHRSEDSRLFYG